MTMTSEMEDESVVLCSMRQSQMSILVYLVTAARTQVDEAAEYTPMRLLTAAGQLAEMAEPDASARVRAACCGEIRQGILGTSHPGLAM